MNRPLGICLSCAMNPVCHSEGTQPGLRPAVERRRRLARGEKLFEAGSPGPSVFAVRAGFLKVCMAQGGGAPRIVRFLLPGDVAGLDVLGGRVHATEAEALEDSEVCDIPAARLAMLADLRPSIAAHLRRLFAAELAEAQAHGAGVAGLAAPQRVAGFLLDMGRRWTARGYSGRRFRLPMGRREIGNHLGLTMETVSRILSGFRARGWILATPGGVALESIESLQAVSRDGATWRKAGTHA
jgi:CRP/FNR family transcriptional regulator